MMTAANAQASHKQRVDVRQARSIGLGTMRAYVLTAVESDSMGVR